MNKNRSRNNNFDDCYCVSPCGGQLKRCKKLLDQKLKRLSNWQINGDDENEQMSDICEHAYQQQVMSQTMSFENGQRLFTYAMEPAFFVPPMYRMNPSMAPNLHCRPTRTDCCRSNHNAHKVPLINSDIFTNGCMNKNGGCQVPGRRFVACSQSDYTSLPPTANIECKSSKEELNSEHRRYSDPGLAPAETHNEQKADESDEESRSSITTISENNKLVVTLIEQMTTLKESNSQLFKELHRTKEELQNVKSELSRLKQNANFGYQPGTLSEIIRELRDASRIREETMMSRVKSMLEDNDTLKLTEIEHLKVKCDRYGFV